MKEHEYCVTPLLSSPALLIRDQSCADILDLYHKMRSEVSSGGEAEVTRLLHETSAVFLLGLSFLADFVVLSQIDIDVDSDTPGTSAGHRVKTGSPNKMLDFLMLSVSAKLIWFLLGESAEL